MSAVRAWVGGWSETDVDAAWMTLTLVVVFALAAFSR